MTLDKYIAKRDFNKTPEPRGEVAQPGARLSFVIQKHAASKLHYDFRLELDGTLKSWAIPRGPSLDPREKRLAVHVEDHPVSYGSFEGTIPAHEYGGGEVIVWDRGSWTPVGDPAEGYRKGHLKFRLEGEKLSGGWALLRMRRPGSDKDNWLLVKERDESAREGKEAEVTELLPDSVLSGRSVGKAARTAPAKTGKALKAEAQARSAAAPKAAKRAGPAKTGQGVKAPLPAMLEPQLATLTDRAPEGDDWLAEIKFDGYRALCRIDKGKAVFYTRAGNDWTAKWPDIAEAATQLPAETAWLDGEVVALDEQGNVSFQMLQNMAQHRGRLAYYAFDLPYLNGYDLRAMPLSQRKELLRTLLEKADPAGPVRYSDHLQGKVADAFSHACMHGLEGIMVKRADAPYAATRTESWLKVKCQQRQEFVVGGYTDPAGKREKFGALLLGVFEDDGSLRYVGRVGTGFNADTLRALHKDFTDLATDAPPFRDPPKKRGTPGLHWLQPKLIAEVKFAQWTNDGLIRQGAFMGMRSDKPAGEIRQERPVPVEEAERHAREETGDAAPANTRVKRSAGRDKPAPDQAVVAGVRLSHATRILFSEARVTKLDLAHYYEDIADWILPHLKQRPLTLVRCPQGHHCFFQKHANETTAEGVGRIEVPTGGATATYMSAGTLPGLISLVQMGVLELHTWGAREGHLDRPDRMIFDLDPDAGLEWKQVVEGAQLVRSLLRDIGLTSFVKTTGGKGLHVVVPLAPRHTWDEVKAFSKAVAAQLEQVLPDRFIANMSKARRSGRIFVDYLRNASEATAVAAYSTRAKPHAAVSTPLHWDELADSSLRSDHYTVLNLRQRLASLKQDPWADYFKVKQEISRKMRDAFEA
ncbi:DNA ligase D|uniref:DNA ligase D n=1 Tax=Noviherbaspirillum sp. L7-7A TaxID=2850560 RepID=UPI001C2CAAB0|nr:DNA ligase D [Noviherbaspirillum sp. L7-7A]MBV0879697.1 DNA ligase D [Noviherbaspirillum sp. L7-7A]